MGSRDLIDPAATGDCRGCWDAARVQQAIRNLVSNTFRYGAPDSPVRVVLRGTDADLRLEVANRGEPIDPSVIGEIFDPLNRGASNAAADERGSLGLGLFIVREIARAHGGEVDVSCDSGETTFALRLPRGNERGRCELEEDPIAPSRAGQHDEH